MVSKSIFVNKLLSNIFVCILSYIITNWRLYITYWFKWSQINFKNFSIVIGGRIITQFTWCCTDSLDLYIESKCFFKSWLNLRMAWYILFHSYNVVFPNSVKQHFSFFQMLHFFFIKNFKLIFVTHKERLKWLRPAVSLHGVVNVV